jgi:hypothetical protein
MTHAPLANGEVWHLDKWACFKLSAGEDNTKPNIVELSPDRDLYVVAGRDENGDKIKLSLRMIHMDDEDMHPVEQYGPSFIKRNENGHLYKCQMFTSHALPVGTRLPARTPVTNAPIVWRWRTSSTWHTTAVAQYIRKKVFKEWWFRTMESRWYNHPTFEEAFFSEGTSTFEVLRRTLNDIATYLFWKLRCNIL